ncbi:universal stress protein [Sedimenticola thiotaurini]|uniref:Universal stress protein n=1 Tax=Sedimenticola thiotaurini TaxID=1543721 RepID=A0A0F7JXJ6_9GAMM|nr:universal stress protein [Sedimenticola thiotaurini]AKH19525.1 hypothetical protein AAY24_03215 [Sedimenticola thiotaurini]
MKAYQQILLATDFSKFSEIAARRAVDLVGHFNAMLTLLHVVEYFPEDKRIQQGSVKLEDLAQHLEGECRKRLEQLARRIQYHAAVLIVRVTPGAAKYEIVQVAREIRANLIVIGPYGQGGASALLGSTAEGVLLEAPCEVLIVRGVMAD